MSDLRQLLFEPTGRVNRKTYWIASFVLAVVAGLPGLTIEYVTGETLNSSAPLRWIAVDVLADLCIVWPSFCVTAKRLHDFGGSTRAAALIVGASCCLFVASYAAPAVLDGELTVFGIVWIVLALCIVIYSIYIGLPSGEPGPNQYGDPTA